MTISKEESNYWTNKTATLECALDLAIRHLLNEQAAVNPVAVTEHSVAGLKALAMSQADDVSGDMSGTVVNEEYEYWLTRSTVFDMALNYVVHQIHTQYCVEGTIVDLKNEFIESAQRYNFAKVLIAPYTKARDYSALASIRVPMDDVKDE